jgi:membrane-bound serine protease (ClpP class)
MSDTFSIVAALLVIGYLFLLIEVFVTPGVGLLGLAGVACLSGGCVMAFVWYGAQKGSLLVVVTLASATALLVIVPRTRFGRRMVHRESLRSAQAGEARVEVGQVGTAESDLRPAGIARFGDLRQSVVADGEFVTAGTVLRVVDVHGSRVVVEAIPANDEIEDEAHNLRGD